MPRPAARKPSRGPSRPAQQSATDRARKAAASRFTRRTADLFLAYVRAGRSTPALAAAARRLKADIDAWSDRYGPSGLRATARTARAKDADDWNGAWTCKRCQWVMVSLGRVCFLVGCDPEYKSCSYICVTVPRDPNYPVS